MRSERRRLARVLGVLPRLLRFVFLLLAAALLPSAAGANPDDSPASANPVYNPQTFAQELNRLSWEFLDHRDSAEQLEHLRNSLPPSWTVENAGRRYEVSSRLLAEQLRKDVDLLKSKGTPSNYAKNYLESVADEAAALPSKPPQDTAAARASLDAILARPEFRHVEEKSWLQKLRDRIDEFIANLLGRLLGRAAGQGPLARILLWIGIAAAALLIAYWIFRFWFRAARESELELQSVAAAQRSWQEWIFAARDSAAHGDYRTAIHCSYWAGIARLQEAGALSADRARTPREYLGALNKSSVLQPETFVTRKEALALLTARLEKIWYGYHSATETDFRDSLAQLETLGCRLP